MGPEEFLGYTGGKKIMKMNYLKLLNNHEPSFVIKRVDLEMLEFLIENEFKVIIGQWILAAGSCQEGHTVYGPFDEMDGAVEQAQKLFDEFRLIATGMET